MIEIPVSNSPEQLFSLEIDQVVYNFRIIYNTRWQVWTMDVLDNSNIEILTGVTLVGGVNLLEQHNIGITNLFAINIADRSLDANIENLGTDVGLFILTEAELNELTV